MFRHTTLFLTAILAVTLIAPSAAHAGAPDGAFRVYAARFEPTAEFKGSLDIGGGPIATTIEAESATGIVLGWEIVVGERLGIVSELVVVEYDFELQAMGGSADFGSATAIPLLFGLQWHLGKSERVDFYAGPLVAYTLWGDLESDVGVATLDSELDFGLRAGVDVLLSEHWALSGRLDYTTAAAGDQSATIDVDPLVLGLGLAYRY